MLATKGRATADQEGTHPLDEIKEPTLSLRRFGNKIQKAKTSAQDVDFNNNKKTRRTLSPLHRQTSKGGQQWRRKILIFFFLFWMFFYNLFDF